MKLLIVDNEEMLVEIMRMGFEAKGVDTLPAYDGEQALKLIAEDANKDIGVLLTDISMPSMDGWRLIAEAKKLRPDITVMVLSAESTTEELARPLLERGDIVAVFDKSMLSPTSFADKVLSSFAA